MVITVLIAFSSLLGIATVQAADKETLSGSRPIDIRVQGAGFGANPADIKAVLESAVGELWQYCSDARIPGIDVYHRSDRPQTDLKLTAEGRIAIGLTARGNHWGQYAFQFAHEYCHALINYSNNYTGVAARVRSPNLWLEESLCETASLFTLQAVSHSWLRAPYPGWQDYAHWFSAYLEERLAMPEHRLPVETPFIVWFRANKSSLRRDGTRRDRNTIIAAQFLPIFEKEPRGWGVLAFFNRASNPNQSLSQLFTDWRSRCPRELQGFVAKLAAVFEVKA